MTGVEENISTDMSAIVGVGNESISIGVVGVPVERAFAIGWILGIGRLK